jgi:carbohydrate kinase (thermoresistant glucokinase family)
MRAGIPLTDQDRSPWLATLADELADQEKNGGCVLACSALKAGYRIMLAAHTRPFFVFLKADPELINKRMAARQGHYMNPALVQSQFETLEEPEDALIVDASLTVLECVSHILAGLDSVNESGWPS